MTQLGMFESTPCPQSRKWFKVDFRGRENQPPYDGYTFPCPHCGELVTARGSIGTILDTGAWAGHNYYGIPEHALPTEATP